MADNNYKESNSLGDNYVLTNPYACPTNAMKISIDKVAYCQYYASFGYVVAAGGATVTATPLTGNLGTDLDYYRVQVSDGSTTVANSLDLANPTAAFVINTSTLDPSAPWTLMFAGSEGDGIGDAGCDLCYSLHLGVVGVAGASGDSIPASWVNVSFLLKEVAGGTDPNFNLFPADGLEIADGETVDLTQFLDGGATQLTNAASIVFTLEMKKRELQPKVSAAPTVPTNDVFASFANTVSYPYGVEKNFDEVLNAVTIDTATAGTFSEAMTFLLTDEGVKPSVSFTLTTDVAV